MATRYAIGVLVLFGAALFSSLATASSEQRPSSAWTMNDAGLAILERSEGLRLQSYADGRTWRVGYGHSTNVTKGMSITAAQALAYLLADIKVCEAGIGEMVTVPLTRNEFSALVSLCFSTGTLRLKSSTVVARLNAGDRASAAEGFLLWVKAGGKPDPKLVALRTVERDLFLN
jgi:lysozyme